MKVTKHKQLLARSWYCMRRRLVITDDWFCFDCWDELPFHLLMSFDHRGDCVKRFGRYGGEAW